MRYINQHFTYFNMIPASKETNKITTAGKLYLKPAINNTKVLSQWGDTWIYYQVQSLLYNIRQGDHCLSAKKISQEIYPTLPFIHQNDGTDVHISDIIVLQVSE